jgi:hypothetical protein
MGWREAERKPNLRHSGHAMTQPRVSTVDLAARAGHLRPSARPAVPALGRARVFDDHLAGDMAVELMDALLGRKLLARSAGAVGLTRKGEQFFCDFGIAPGALGAAMLGRLYDLGWARCERTSRIVLFSPRGLREFERLFGAAADAKVTPAAAPNHAASLDRELV